MLRGLLVSFQPESLLFIGGEPTLYTEKINTILEGNVVSPSTAVVITTNGHFAVSRGAAVSAIKKFRRLDHVQLSYDNYHKEFISLDNVSNLRKACEDLGVHFGVLISVKSPLDLVLLKDLKAAGVKDSQVRIQGVHLIGAAAVNGIGYDYPSFNEQVLSRKCESIGNMVYLCGEGFTSCCSHLAFEEENRSYIHPTIEDHIASKFHGLVMKHTFGELLELAGLSKADLVPAHSYICALCAHIFKGLQKNRPDLLG